MPNAADVKPVLPLLTPKEAAKILRIGDRTLFNRTYPHGPIAAVRIGPNCVRYTHEALQRYIDSLQSSPDHK